MIIILDGEERIIQMNDQNEKKEKKLPTQMVLLVRGIGALYLLYMAFEMIKMENLEDPRRFIIICAAAFVIIGAGLFIWTLRSFIKGEYEGGKADPGSMDKEVEEINNRDSE